jgi:hypothetical protein
MSPWMMIPTMIPKNSVSKRIRLGRVQDRKGNWSEDQTRAEWKLLFIEAMLQSYKKAMGETPTKSD